MEVDKSTTIAERIIKRIPFLNKLYYDILNSLLHRGSIEEDNEDR